MKRTILCMSSLLAVSSLGCSKEDDKKTTRDPVRQQDDSCPPGLSRCGEACVDLSANVAHCGGCDVACEEGTLCSAGTCVERCADGLTECEGACVDTQRNANACGGCGQVCDAQQRCVEGACASCVAEALDTASFPIEVTFDTRQSSDVARGSCGKGNSPETVLSFTAPREGVYEFSTDGSTFNTVLYVLEETCGGKELACNDDYAGGLSSYVAVPLSKGQTVAVVVDGFDGQAGKATLRVVDAGGLQCCKPHNEPGCGVRSIEECVCAHDSFCCEAAWDDGCIETMIEHGCGRCTMSGECDAQAVALSPQALPIHLDTNVDSVRLSCGQLGIADALFSFTADEAGLYRFSTRDADADTVLGVLAEPACNAEELACNDDGLAGLAGELTTFLNAGQTVLVVVEAFDNKTAASSLRVERIGTAPDSSCGAIPLPPDALAVVSGRFNGTRTGRAGSCTVQLGGSALYAFKAPAAGRYQFDTTGSGVDTALAVFDGCEGEELACNDDNEQGWGSTVFVDLEAGQEVMISVSSFEQGPYGLAYGLEGTPGTVFPGTGCCSEHDSPGCKSPEIEQCVCATDAFCCELGWDSLCVTSVEFLGCGSCE